MGAGAAGNLCGGAPRTRAAQERKRAMQGIRRQGFPFVVSCGYRMPTRRPVVPRAAVQQVPRQSAAQFKSADAGSSGANLVEVVHVSHQGGVAPFAQLRGEREQPDVHAGQLAQNLRRPGRHLSRAICRQTAWLGRRCCAILPTGLRR